ncbi:MAG: hypothetical protein H6Q92_2019 [Nitrospirae bacterium]|nr:hypothetical protein [Nitrospirota bacterium]
MRKPRILLFDDDNMLLEVLHYYFSARNFEVQSFSEPVLCPLKNKAIMSGALPDDFLDKMKEVADTFFQKPVHMQELNEWARNCISHHDLSQPLGSYGKAMDV